MPQLYDAFISYGRADSKAFAAKLCHRLTEQGYRIWFDLNDIPLGVDFQQQIDDDLERSHNFIFIMSPHSVNSDYCRLEVERAVRCHKRIIPLLHVEEIGRDIWQQRHPGGTDADWATYQAEKRQFGDVRNPRLHPILSKINWIDGREDQDDLDATFAGLVSIFERHRDYVQAHTRLLVKALEWENQQRRSPFLLIGEERQQAEAWLQIRFKDEQPPCTPTDLHCEYITESIKNANNLMTQVFLASAEADQAFKERIRRSLMREGLTVWTNKTDVQTGADFRRAIAQGIESADNVVLLLSPATLQSDYCRQEIDYAQRLNKRMIPLLVEPLGDVEMAEPLKALQFIDFTNRQEAAAYDNDVAKLIRALRLDEAYYAQHKTLLVKALKWKRQNQNTSILLRGYNLHHAEAWLKTAVGRSQYPPTPLHHTFITTSLQHPQESSLDVFISYSRADSDMARRLNNALQTQGKTTWFDQESIASGTDFQREIYRGIQQCDNFLFILSPRSVNSPYCADEVDYAASLNKRIVTVLYRPVDPADLHPTLAAVQWIDFNQHGGEFYPNFSELVRTLDTDREHVHQHTQWLQRSLDWQSQDQNPDLLLRGSEFAVAEGWLNTALALDKKPAATDSQKAFIHASRDAIDAERRKEKRQTVILRSLLGLVSGVAVIAVGSSVWAMKNQRQAMRNEVEAHIATATAESTLGHNLDALLNGLRAARQLQDNRWLRRDVTLHQHVMTALQEAIYKVHHRNRLAQHQDWVMALHYSPDGEILASLSVDGTLCLWQADGTLIATDFQTPSETDYLDAVFSADGRTLTLIHEDAVEVWSMDGQWLNTLEIPDDAVNGELIEAVISPNGQYLALLSHDGTLTVWEMTDGTQLTPLPFPTALPDTGTADPDSPNPDDSNPDAVNAEAPDNGLDDDALDTDDILINRIAFSPDSQRLATGTDGGMVSLWELDGTLIRRFQGHDDGIEAIAFSPDGELLAVGGDSNLVHLWWNDGTLQQTLKYEDVNLASSQIRFSPDGQTLAVAMSNHAIALWNIGGVPMGTLWSHVDQINTLAFSPDGQTLASGGADNTVQLWDVANPLSSQWAADEAVFSAAEANGRFLTAIYGEDGSIDIWNGDGRWHRRIDDLDDLEQAFLSGDGRVIITVQADGRVQRWDTDGTPLQTLRPATGEWVEAALSPDGQTLITAADLGPVQLWNTDGTLLQTLIAEDKAGDYIEYVGFTNQGQALILGYWGGLVQHWDLASSTQTSLYDGSWSNAAVSPDEPWLALDPDYRNVELIDIQNQEQITLNTGHRSDISQLSFSPDNQQLVTSSFDNTIRLWDLDKPEMPLAILHDGAKQHTDAITFRADGRILATGNDEYFLVMRALPGIDDLDTLVQRGCGHLHDFLQTNPDIAPGDRTLCDSIDSLPKSEWPEVPQFTVPLPTRP